MNATWPHWWFVNIRSGNWLMPSGKQPITWTIVFICQVLWHHRVSLDHSELMGCALMLWSLLQQSTRWDLSMNICFWVNIKETCTSNCVTLLLRWTFYIWHQKLVTLSDDFLSAHQQGANLSEEVPCLLIIRQPRILFTFSGLLKNLMGWCKKNLTPLLMHWSYVFLALTHWI